MRFHSFCVIYFCGIEKEIMINGWREEEAAEEEEGGGISSAGVY